jgi:hypothetical protein
MHLSDRQSANEWHELAQMHADRIGRRLPSSLLHVPHRGFLEEKDCFRASLCFLQDICQLANKDPLCLSPGRCARAAAQPASRHMPAALFDVPDAALLAKTWHAVAVDWRPSGRALMLSLRRTATTLAAGTVTTPEHDDNAEKGLTFAPFQA